MISYNSNLISKALEQTFKPGYKVYAMVSKQFIVKYKDNKLYKSFFNAEDPMLQDRTKHGWADFLVVHQDGKTWFRVAEAGKEFNQQIPKMYYHKAQNLDTNHLWLVLKDDGFKFISFKAYHNVILHGSGSINDWTEFEPRTNKHVTLTISMLEPYIRYHDIRATKRAKRAKRAKRNKEYLVRKYWKKSVRRWVKRNPESLDFPETWSTEKKEYALQIVAKAEKPII